MNVFFRSVTVNSQKLIKLEQKKRKRLKEKMEKLEEALKSAGAPPEALKILREELTNNNNTTPEQPNDKEDSASPTPLTTSPYTPPTTQSRTPTADAPAATGDAKPWNYASMDLIASGTAFWQNYSGKSPIIIIFYFFLPNVISIKISWKFEAIYFNFFTRHRNNKKIRVGCKY